MFKKIFTFIVQHKIMATIAAIALAGVSYSGYKSLTSTQGEVHYVLAAVQKGTITFTVSGSGQVSVSNQVDVKSKTNGDITNLYVKLGQEVTAGTLLATMDTSDAARTVRDAETSLETAKLELDQLLEPLDALTLLQAENSVTQAKESKQKAEDDLSKAYDDGFNTVANAFLDLSPVMTGLHNILLMSTLASNQRNIDFYTDSVLTYDEKVLQYKQDTNNSYQTARNAYDKNFTDYKSTSRFSDRNVIEALINQTYDTTKDIAEAVKNSNNLIQFYIDKLSEQNIGPIVLAATHLANLNTYISKTNAHLLNLLSIKRTLQTAKETLVNAGRTIEEKELSLAKIKKGPDDLDIRAKKIAIQQKEDALTSAEETLADHYIRAPFDGVVAKLSVKKGDSASAGTIFVTMVTKQKIAEISLNEVDVSKVKMGQKAMLTFDAVPDLSISGEVSEIDTIGTTSQGVVSYALKIMFDTQDERIKPGMSVSVNIITDVKLNVLMVPNSAVKSQGNVMFVMMPDKSEATDAGTASPGGVILKNPLRRQTVEVGITNDDFTEITSGLAEGDIVVITTIAAQTAAKTTTQQSGLRIPGLTGSGGGGSNRGGSRGN